MKEFGVSDYDYEHRISVPLRTIMCIDLPRVDYNKGKIKKSEFDAVAAANKEASKKIREAREKKNKEA